MPPASMRPSSSRTCGGRKGCSEAVIAAVAVKQWSQRSSCDEAVIARHGAGRRARRPTSDIQAGCVWWALLRCVEKQLKHTRRSATHLSGLGKHAQADQPCASGAAPHLLAAVAWLASKVVERVVPQLRVAACGRTRGNVDLATVSISNGWQLPGWKRCKGTVPATGRALHTHAAPHAPRAHPCARRQIAGRRQ